MAAAELLQREARDVEAAVDAEREHCGDAGGLKPLGCVGDPPETVAHRGQIGLARRSQDQLAVQPFEQPHAQALFQHLDELADRAGGHVQLVGGELEAEVTGRGLEGAQRIERWQQVCHGALSSQTTPPRLQQIF